MIFITGAGSGFGLSLALEHISRNHDVIPIIRNQRDEFSKLDSIQVDLTNPDQVRKAASSVAIMCTEPSDIVFSAGILGNIDASEHIPLSSIQEAFSINCLSIKPFIDSTLDGPYPVRYWLVSSGAARNPYPGMLSYCISKAAANMLFGVYAAEYPDRMFGVVNPGPMATRMNKKLKLANKEKFPALKKFSDPTAVVTPEIRARQFADLMISTTDCGLISVDLRNVNR